MRNFQLLCFLVVLLFASSILTAEDNFLSGSWMAQGVASKTCMISVVDGNRMKFVTEKGEVGYGTFEDFQTIVVDFPSAKGLKGQISGGNRINWSDGTFWERPSNAGEFANVPVIGASNAKVTIVEYSEFQCPYCKNAHFTLKELFKQYNGKIKIAYKHNPLSIHAWAEDAARASVCIYQQDQRAFWKASDFFFQNQQNISKETLSVKLQEFADRSNLNFSTLQSCMNESSTREKVSADAAEASRLGLNAVPSFVINGKLFQGALPAEQFKEVIDQALAEIQ
jgi:protein-disulfide isomerase